MSRKVSPKSSLSAQPLLITIAVIAVVAVGIAVGVSRGPAQPTQPATAAHFVDLTQQDHHSATAGRSLIIARSDETVPGIISGERGPLMTTLVRGQYPDGVTQATVRSDENCAPDGQGVSHCLNKLDLGTTTIEVQHHHKMSLTPCLTPGETVNIMTLAQYQAQS